MDKRKFILVTADYSGLGFALQEQNVNNSEVVLAIQPKEVKIRSIIKVGDKIYDGKDHGIAIDKAIEAGEKVSQKQRDEIGLFEVNDSRILTRSEALKEFGFKRSEDIPEELQTDFSEPRDEFAKGLAKCFPLKTLMEKRAKLKDWFWIWDSNHNWKENEILRKEGFKVFGGSKFCYDLENDRELGVKFAESTGLETPETKQFKSAQDGIKFLESREDEAFVFKANGQDDCSLTYVPINIDPIKANEELRHTISALNVNDFILQKKVMGTEVNVEMFVMNGEPVFAQANLESKKPMDADEGDATGCAFDVCWSVPLDSKLAQMTVMKFAPKLKEMKYTGFADANVIIDDDKAWFLEFCYRFGYNSHPNFFYNLSKDTALQFAANMIDGAFKADSVKDGFGASITVFSHKPKKGLPIYIPEGFNDKVYMIDGYKEGENLVMSGGCQEICIVCARHFTIPTALEKALDYCNQLVIKGMFKRHDAHKTDYPSSPQRRYEALVSRKLI